MASIYIHKRWNILFRPYCYGCDKCIFVKRMHFFFLTLGAIDILWLVYLMFYANEIKFKIHGRSLIDIKYYYRPSIILIRAKTGKYKAWNESYLKPRKIDAFKQKIWIYHLPLYSYRLYNSTSFMDGKNIFFW